MHPDDGKHQTVDAQAVGSELVEGLRALGIDAPVAPVDFEDVGQRYLREALARDAAARFNANCPAEYRASDWAHQHLAPHRPAIDRILGWRPGKKGILASGPTGRGKSRAMWGLARRLALDEGRDVRFYYAGDWFSSLQQNIRYGRDESQQWVEECARRPIVMIDDLGQQAVQKSREDWSEGWFFRFLDIRIGLGLPLFVTTNLTAEQMAQQQNGIRGNPLVRRLLDLCDVVSFELPDEKARRLAAFKAGRSAQ